MNNMIVRIQKAEIQNLKNVEYGSFRFACNMKKDIFESCSDILGIYGQNGSGKTTFINSLSILKSLLSGKQVSKENLDYIMSDKNNSTLKFEFTITDNKSFYKVIYSCVLGRKKREQSIIGNEDYNPIIVCKEKLNYSYLLESGKWSKLMTLIDYDYEDSEIFRPKSKFAEITGQNQDFIDELRISKKFAIKSSTSFIFSKDTREQLKKNCKNMTYKNIINSLYVYGEINLFIVDNKNTGFIISNTALPLIFKYINDNKLSIGKIPINLTDSSVIPISIHIFDTVKSVIQNMNTVLKMIIPGLSLELINTGEKLMEDGSKGVIAELLSIRGNRKIPFRCESDGIKKIVSILNLLICMYNSSTVTLAVDELDSGIFEYLLGEILKVIDESGKGQLIFTSHNLRPLETLNKSSIIFTTANQSNRYIRLTNIKSTNNLRDFYYHDIILGGQKECIYEPTNSFAISRAFKVAGESHEI